MINLKTFIKIFCFIIVFFSINISFAQNYILKGKVLNKDHKPVEFVQANLFKNDTLLVKTAYSDSLGIFSFQIEKGKYRLVLQEDGINYFQKDLEMNQDTDLGDIEIDKAHSIEKVKITARKKLIERKVDRLVFNVENSIASNGMDGIEMLSNTPMLRVDENTGISIVGKNKVSVMVNDRMINLSGEELMNYLKSLRSDNISKVEIITIPPSKYEAQGNSGIINIILKKNLNIGISGNIATALTQSTWLSTYNNITLNYQNEKLSTSLKLRQSNMLSRAYENYKIVGQQSLESHSKRKDFGDRYGGNLAVDYKLNKKSSIGVIYDIAIGNSNMDINNNSIYNSSGVVTNDLYTEIRNRGYRNSQTLNAYYDLNLGSNEKKMSITTNYFSNVPNTNVNFTTFDKVNEDNYIVKNSSLTDYKIYSGQLDFTLPNKLLNIETGTKFTNFNNNSDVKYFNFSNNNYIIDLLKSNIFNYNEKNYALYLIGNKDFSNKWSVKAGLRYEYSWIDGFSQTNQQRTKYKYGKFFPSLYVTFKPNEDNTFSLSYSRRISRPNFRALNPFRWYTSPYKYFIGNPILQPSYSHNIEFGYIWKSKLSFSASYQKIQNGYDQITSFIGEQIISTYKNYLNTENFGINISYNDNFIKWWQTNMMLYSSYSKSTTFNTNAIGQSGYGLYFSTQNIFNLNTNRTCSFLLNYRQSFPSKDGNTYYYAQGNLSFGLRLFLMNKNLQILVAMNDLLKQQKSSGELYFENNTQYYDNYYDSRNVKLSVTYKFGSNKVKGNNKNIPFEESNRAN